MADDTTTEQIDSTSDVEPTVEAPATETSESSASLGEAGKRALERERKARYEASRALREAQNQLKKFQDRDKSDLERATARAEGAESRIQGLVTKAVRAEVRALASSQFADPADAVAFLDLSSYADEDGEIDAERIQADLAELLERKPHLAKKAPQPEPEARRPAPDRTQASSANAQRSSTPADEFAGFIQSRLAKGR
ncbi:hypothetical protein [Streptosporangium jomthongense]|uniref:Scaffolding protein n=1 Tax=Streptosporangium jomthongense TaxID=1193683 RepID=A0ABV8FCM3_9ACTN